jgi:hypothetical protein
MISDVMKNYIRTMYRIIISENNSGPANRNDDERDGPWRTLLFLLDQINAAVQSDIRIS